MSFVVHINDPVSKALIHRAECLVYINRAGGTRHGYWLTFPSYEEAWVYARSTRKKDLRDCKVCVPGP